MKLLFLCIELCDMKGSYELILLEIAFVIFDLGNLILIKLTNLMTFEVFDIVN